MVNMSIKSIKAGYIIAFILGAVFLVLGLYGLYHLLAVEMPSGHLTKLPFAVAGSILFGLLMIRVSYPIFIPIKKNSFAQSAVCPFCGVIVEGDVAVCQKCERQLENSSETAH